MHSPIRLQSGTCSAIHKKKSVHTLLAHWASPIAPPKCTYSEENKMDA